MMSDTVLTLERPSVAGSRGELQARGRQVLSFANLRVGALLGILTHERATPQAIRVDVELNQGPQPLQPGDHIQQVLDYRQVRQILLEGAAHETEKIVR